MAFSEHLLQEILNKADLVDLVGAYVSLKPNGQRWWGLCPFHQEKSPSFTVNQSGQFFYCFGCQEKGNGFHFLMKIEHLSFPEAVKKLADKTGVLLPTQEESDFDRERNALTELMGRLTGTFHHLLKTHPEAETARQVLSLRGISEKMVETFQLGYALADRFWLKKFLLAKKYDEGFLQKSGLFSSQYPDIFLFSGRLLFPIRLPSKETVGFGGRVLGDDRGPKYLNSPESPVFQKRKTLYAWEMALNKVREKQEVILCEGYMDAISLHQAGLDWAAAPLGTAFTEDQAHLLKRYCKTVICLFDNDEAGRKATAKAVEICEVQDLETKVVIVKGNKDPAEILEKEGAEAVRNLLDQSQKGFDFLLDFYYTSSNRNSSFDLRGFLRDLFAFLARLTSGVRRETYLNRTADFLGVSQDTLKTDFEKGGDFQTRRALVPKSSERPQKPEAGRSVEWGLLMTVLSNPALYQVLRRDLSLDDFEEERSRKLFSHLEEAAGRDELPEQQGQFRLEDVIARVEPEEWGGALVRDVMSGEYDLNSDRLLADGIQKLRRRNLEGQRRKVRELLRSPTLTSEEAQRLVQEVKFLDKEILRLKGNA